MDTDSCDVIIKVLSNVLSRLIDVNRSHVGHQLITKFQSSYPPEVSIHAYLERIKKYAGCSDSCFVVALIYIDRMIEIRNVVLTSLNVHRLIITSLMLAAKFFDDYFYNNAFYAKLGGVAPLEMNSLELEFLQLLNFSLFVSPEVYSKYNAELRNYVGVVNIPVYMSSYPNSPTSAKASKGNYFVSRPPSTSPFLPLVETVRLPTPPLLDPDFVPALNAQSYYHRVLESKSTAAQVTPYESHSPHLQRTFIKSSPPPSDEADGAPYTYISPSSFAPDQTSGGSSFGQYCVVPICGQFYEKGRHVSAHYAYTKQYCPSDPTGSFTKTSVQSDDRQSQTDRNYSYPRHELYDPYSRPTLANCHYNALQHDNCPTNYSNQSQQMISTNTSNPSISHTDPYVKPVSHEENIEEYRRVAVCGGNEEVMMQSPYYLTPFSSHSTPAVGCSKADNHRLAGGCVSDYQTSVPPAGNAGPERSHYFPLSLLKGQICGYPTHDKYFSNSVDAPSMSSFSDDTCESGATTPASERSTYSVSGISRRSSLISSSNEGPLCAPNGASQIYFPQAGGGSYYSQQQLQQPHYIIAS